MTDQSQAQGGAEAEDGLRTEVLRTARFFFRNLFDLRMRMVVSFCTLPIVYGLGILITAAWVIAVIVSAFMEDWALGLFWLILAGPVVFITVVASLRIALELMLAVFRMSMHVEAVSHQTEEIAVDLPRLQFWRNFRIRRDGGE